MYVYKCQSSVFIISFIERPHLSESLAYPEQFQPLKFPFQRKTKIIQRTISQHFSLGAFFFNISLFIMEVLACIVKAIHEILRQMRNKKLGCILNIYTHICIYMCVYLYTYLLIFVYVYINNCFFNQIFTNC